MSLTIRKRRLQGHQAHGETFSQLDLSSISAPQSRWVDCVFDRCDMTLGDFSHSTFERCRFLECDLRLTSFRGSSIRECGFAKCNLRQSAFVATTPLADTTFDGCKMHYSSFFDATVYRTSFLKSNLHGADLRFIEAAGNEFAETVLWNVAVQVGCQLWGARFDAEPVEMLIALASRIHPNPDTAKALRELSGKMYRTVSRLMDEPADKATPGV